MYFNFLGGSALLHLLAAHPKVVAAFGTVTTIALLATSMGPQNYLGAGRHARSLEQAVTVNGLVSEQVIARAVADAQRMAEMPAPDIEQAIRRVLRECGKGCADLTPAVVLNDAVLLEKALYVSELSRHAGEQNPVIRDRIAQLMARR